MLLLSGCPVFLSAASAVSAIVLDVHDRNSILDATHLLAHGVQELYNGNVSGGTPGKWPFPPYYWWQSGGAWGGMMQYWAFTRDESYTSVMLDALVSQLGPGYDFIVPQEASNSGNDDVAFWVIVAMAAAEYGFPPPPSPAPGWHHIVENAWNDYALRWMTTGSDKCGGGLKCTLSGKASCHSSLLTRSRAILP